MDDNLILVKSKKFAIRIINLTKVLKSDRKEFTLSEQILRSGTSIGANVAEAECAVSRKDFLSKMHIAFKECSETLYWLDLLYETDYVLKAEYDSLSADCIELKKILSAITKTAKENSDFL